MTGGIYRSKFEAMKAPHIMRRRVSYMIEIVELLFIDIAMAHVIAYLD